MFNIRVGSLESTIGGLLQMLEAGSDGSADMRKAVEAVECHTEELRSGKTFRMLVGVSECTIEVLNPTDAVEELERMRRQLNRFQGKED